MLQAHILGTFCVERRASSQFNKPVENTFCTNSLIVNDTQGYWWPTNDTTPIGWHPFPPFPTLNHLWANPGNISLSWHVPEGMFWICKLTAYSRLPRKWSSSCVLGIIRTEFFLLPKTMGDTLSVPVYNDLKQTRQSLEIGGTQADEEWPPAQFIKYYGPAI